MPSILSRLTAPTPEPTEAEIDFLVADAAPGSAIAGDDVIALEMSRGIRLGGFTPGASATSISTLANIMLCPQTYGAG